MRYERWILTAAAMATAVLIPSRGYAVDGVILIDQNRAIAGGVTPGDTPGFPVTLSQPGSYRLSGNLTMATSASGNFMGHSIAIAIASSGVTLDLNGFTISVTNAIQGLAFDAYAIAEIGTYSQIVIRNGMIEMSEPGLTTLRLWCIFLNSSDRIILEDLNVSVSDISSGIAIGPRSVVRHNILSGVNNVTCPSLIVENLGRIGVGSGCLLVNNTP